MKFKFAKDSSDSNQVSNTQAQASAPSPVVKNSDPSKPELKIITLGGTTAVTKNMTVYECGNDMIVVDCGFGFPDSEMLGVDVVLPDISYILENRHKLRALFITHGHDDHIGGIAFLIKDLGVPIYSTKLVQNLIQVKLREKNNLEGVRMLLVNPDGDPVTVGCFTVDYFRVNHSVPDSCGLAIKTPQGMVFHCADFKFDWTPVLDKPFDVAKMTRLAQNGVEVLLSDCLGSTTEGYARSERSIESTFDELLEKAVGEQVFITTVSSNVSRMYQAIDSAVKHGRKVVILGRSFDQVTEVARKLGYLDFGEGVFVDREKARKYPQSELLYITAGAYGQPESAISRIARGEHKDVTLEDGAYVIFSADPNPPGVRDHVDVLIDRLTLGNAIVIYSEIQENLHVSGHGLRGDLKLMAALSKAKYFVPIGGTVKNMRAYANMISEMGVPLSNIYELLEGESVILRDGVAKMGPLVPTTNVFVDGSVVGDVGQKVIDDRTHLSQDGIVVVVIAMDRKEKQPLDIQIITRGFIYVKESKELIQDATTCVRNAFNQNKADLDGNRGQFRGRVENALGKFLFKQTGREPLVLVSLIEV